MFVGDYHAAFPIVLVGNQIAESGAVDSHGLSGVSGAQNVQIGLAWGEGKALGPCLFKRKVPGGGFVSESCQVGAG